MWMGGCSLWVLTHLSQITLWLLISSHAGASLPSAGGTKTHSRLLIKHPPQSFPICRHLDRFSFSRYSGFRKPPVSFSHADFHDCDEKDTSIHPRLMLTPLTARCNESPPQKSSTQKFLWPEVWLLNDSQAQPIKFSHNLCSICIEKKSLSLAVDIRAALPSRRIERIWRKCRHVFTKTH